VPEDAKRNKLVRREIFGDTSLTGELKYNALYDKHLKQHFYESPALRDHLTTKGIITEDWRVVGTRDEFFQGLKAHRELLDREEIVAKLSAKQSRRFERFSTNAKTSARPSVTEASLFRKEVQQLDVNAADRRLAASDRKHRRQQKADADRLRRFVAVQEQDRAYKQERRRQGAEAISTHMTATQLNKLERS
jgi:hypothetical protein